MGQTQGGDEFVIAWQDEPGVIPHELPDSWRPDPTALVDRPWQEHPLDLTGCASQWSWHNKSDKEYTASQLCTLAGKSRLTTSYGSGLVECVFWVELKLALLAGEKDSLDFDELVDARWRDEPDAYDEEARRELAVRLLDWMFDGNLKNLSKAYYPWQPAWFKAAERLLGPGELVSMLIEREMSPSDLVVAIVELKESSWERRFANGEALEAAGDSFYESLGTRELQKVFKSAPHPRAARAHYERANDTIAEWFLFDVLDDGDDEQFVAWCELYQSRLGYYTSGFGRYTSATRLVLRLGLHEAGLARFAELMKERQGTLAEVLCRLHNPWVVTHCYDLLQRKKISSSWPMLEAWLSGEGANAVRGLVQLGGRRGKRRTFAIDWLTKYVEAGHRELVERALDDAPDKVAAALREELPLSEDAQSTPARTSSGDWTLSGALEAEVVRRDQLIESDDDAPASVKVALSLRGETDALGEWEVCPLVRTRDRSRALSEALVRGLCEGVAAVNYYGSGGYFRRLQEILDRGYCQKDHGGELDRLREELDPEDLDALWLFLREQGGNWVDCALRELGGRRAIARAGARLRWDEKPSGHTRWDHTPDYRLLYGLYMNGDHEAWAELVGSRELAHGRSKDTDFRGAVAYVTRRIAEQTGWTVSQCRARLVPRCGLDDHGQTIYDYGERQITLSVDTSLQVVIKDDKGKVYRSAPGARKGEDRRAVEELKERMKAQRALLVRATGEVRSRFEHELETMYTRTLSALREEILDHPWQRFLVQSLVWGQYTKAGKLKKTFLCDSDGSLVDAEFEAVSLRANTTVALVHPSELSERELLAWEQALADSEIIQPFAQLERTYPEVKSRRGKRLWSEDLDGVGTEWLSSQLVKLPSWRRHETSRSNNSRYGGYIWYCVRDLEQLGVHAAYMFHSKHWVGERQPAGIYFFEPGASDTIEDALPLSKVPVRVLSELLADLQRARALD